VLVYCHYDVQPSDPEDEWVRPPFEPRHEDGRIYARGSGDDKGQIEIHLQAAAAWMRTAGRLPVNLRIFFEGDEEVGSEPADQFVEEHPELLAADVCVVSDTGMHDDEGTPALTYGLRGIAYFEVKVSGPFQDVHSGQYGGGVANPANVLVTMLASLQDAGGRVTIPGFYDRVRPLGEAERSAYAAVPFDAEELRSTLDVPALWEGEKGYTLLERLSARPTLDINGLWGGYSGEGAKTIIPSWAAAKFSTRLVPDQDYHEIERLVTEHLRSIAPPAVRVEVRVIHGGAPALTPLDHPAVAVAARALEQTFGRKPVFLRSGGSIPVVAALESHLGLKSVLIGFSSPNDNAHAPNEWMPESNIHNGTEAIVRLWSALGELTPEQLHPASAG
jgi:acetylornithine deacetylase/succinyl-diaminopimelate desuccinylase-like protein